MLTILQSYDSYSYESSSSASALGAIFGIGMMFFYLALYLFLGFCLMKIFKKAGRDDAWAGFIPIYNIIVLLDIVKKPWYWLFIAFIPFVGGLILMYIIGDRLAKVFGKGDSSVMWGIITALTGGLVTYIVFAFGSEAYDGNAVPDERG